MRYRACWRAAVRSGWIAAMLLLTAAVHLGIERAAMAQPGNVDDAFTDLTFQEAIKESMRTDRLLIVVNTDSRIYNPDTWANKTLQAYIKWHAIAIRVKGKPLSDCEVGTLEPYAMRAFGTTRNPYDNIASAEFFVNGCRANAALMYFDKNTARIKRDTVVRGNAVGMLIAADSAIESAKTRDPLWGLRHDDRNPMPLPPEETAWLFLGDDGLADPVSDVQREGATIGAVLERLEAARKATAAGDHRAAVGLYTWLWERGEQIDPAFGPARLWLVAREMGELTKVSQSMRTRAAQLHARVEARLPWAMDREWYELAMSGLAKGSMGTTMIAFEGVLNDPQEAAMSSVSPQARIFLMASRSDEIEKLAPGTEAFLKKQTAELKKTRPKGATKEDWDDLQKARRWIIRMEGCRGYAYWLTKGNEVEAGRIATIVQSVHGPEVSAYLVATALAAGEVRPVHAEWLRKLPPEKGRVLLQVVEERLKALKTP